MSQLDILEAINGTPRGKLRYFDFLVLQHPKELKKDEERPDWDVETTEVLQRGDMLSKNEQCVQAKLAHEAWNKIVENMPADAVAAGEARKQMECLELVVRPF
jgi:hypothetical protein